MLFQCIWRRYAYRAHNPSEMSLRAFQKTKMLARAGALFSEMSPCCFFLAISDEYHMKVLSKNGVNFYA
jgi:hypothetical protein